MKRLNYKIYFEVKCERERIIYSGELPIFKNEKEENSSIIKKYLSRKYNLEESDIEVVTHYRI